MKFLLWCIWVEQAMQTCLLSVVQLGLTGRLSLDRKPVGSTAEQLRLRDSMLADLRNQNKALAGQNALPALHRMVVCGCNMLHVPET